MIQAVVTPFLQSKSSRQTAILQLSNCYFVGFVIDCAAYGTKSLVQSCSEKADKKNDETTYLKSVE
jgi:hypothetical protein